MERGLLENEQTNKSPVKFSRCSMMDGPLPISIDAPERGVI